MDSTGTKFDQSEDQTWASENATSQCIAMINAKLTPCSDKGFRCWKIDTTRNDIIISFFVGCACH